MIQRSDSLKRGSLSHESQEITKKEKWLGNSIRSIRVPHKNAHNLKPYSS
jgi:hypothetical protein